MKCRVCLEECAPSYLLKSTRSDLKINLYFCKRCNAYFSNGGPVNYDDSNPVDYYLAHRQSTKERYGRIFEYVEEIIQLGSFFDIGAGIGFSLDVADERGWRASGIEPNIILVNHARDRGVDISHGYLNESASGDHDFVLVDNVLEHVLDPHQFLTLVKSRLSSTGLLMIAVPPMDWLRKGLGSFGYVRASVNAPQFNIFRETDEHVNFFSRVAMRALLEKSGLRLLNIRFHHSRWYNNPLFRIVGLDDGYYFATHA